MKRRQRRSDTEIKLIERDNYIIAYQPIGGHLRIMVCVRIIRSQSFANAKRRALEALWKHDIPYEGNGIVMMGLDPNVEFDEYLVYVEPMGSSIGRVV